MLGRRSQVIFVINFYLLVGFITHYMGVPMCFILRPLEHCCCSFVMLQEKQFACLRHWHFFKGKIPDVYVIKEMVVAPVSIGRVPALRGDKSNFSNKYFLYFIILFLFLFGFLPRFAFHPTALLLFRRPYNLANAISLLRRGISF